MNCNERLRGVGQIGATRRRFALLHATRVVVARKASAGGRTRTGVDQDVVQCATSHRKRAEEAGTERDQLWTGGGGSVGRGRARLGTAASASRIVRENRDAYEGESRGRRR